MSSTRSPARSRRATAAPRPRMASASGASTSPMRVEPAGGAARRTASPARPRRSPAPPRTGSSRAAPPGRRPRRRRRRARRAIRSAAATRSRATPRPWAAGTTPNRRRNSVSPTGSNSSAPTGRPSSSASSPPSPRAARARTRRVSADASAGGSRTGRAPNASRTTASTSSAASAPTGDRRTTAHRAPDPLRGRRDQLVEGGVDLVVPLEDHHVPGALALEQRRAGDPLVQLAAVADRGELVLGAADDRGRHPRQRLDRRRTCRASGSSGRTRATTSNGVAESISSTNSTYAAGTSSPNANRSVATIATARPARRSPSTMRCPRARVRTARWVTPPVSLAGIIGSRIRLGSSPPAVVETRPTPTTRSPNSSGCCSASATIVMPPIEWPTSDDRPLRRDRVEDRQQVVAELLDGRVVVARAARPAVRALVVEDGAHQAAVGRALEVPAVQVQREAVHEHHRERRRLPALAPAAPTGTSLPRAAGRARRPRRAAGPRPRRRR